MKLVKEEQLDRHIRNQHDYWFEKEKGRTIQLWILAFLIFFSAPFFVGAVTDRMEAHEVKKAVLASINQAHSSRIQDVEIKRHPNNRSLFFAVLEQEEEW